MVILIAATLFVGIFLPIFVSAKRFAARARKAGTWDDKGPLVETAGPERRFFSGRMEERLEVTGDWTPPIINDRRPTSTENTKQNRDHPEGDRDLS